VDPTGAGETDGNASAATLRTGLALGRLSVPAVWQAYTAGGGTLHYRRIADAFAGTYTLDAVDHDLLARVLNQDPTLRGTQGIVRYSPDLDHDASRQPPS